MEIILKASRFFFLPFHRTSAYEFHERILHTSILSIEVHEIFSLTRLRCFIVSWFYCITTLNFIFREGQSADTTQTQWGFFFFFLANTLFTSSRMRTNNNYHIVCYVHCCGGGGTCSDWNISIRRGRICNNYYCSVGVVFHK